MNLKDAILKAYPKAATLDIIAPVLEKCMDLYDMNTPQRKAMFIAQLLLESGGFKYRKEIWGNTPTVWQAKYEGHLGLGNTQPGDGKKFLGRGFIQLTGRKNYTAFAKWISDPTILDTPEKVERVDYAVLSAIWYWTNNKLNDYADKDDIKGCTRAVNGSKMLGLQERTKYWEYLLQSLNIQ